MKATTDQIYKALKPTTNRDANHFVIAAHEEVERDFPTIDDSSKSACVISYLAQSLSGTEFSLRALQRLTEKLTDKQRSTILKDLIEEIISRL